MRKLIDAEELKRWIPTQYDRYMYGQFLGDTIIDHIDAMPGVPRCPKCGTSVDPRQPHMVPDDDSLHMFRCVAWVRGEYQNNEQDALAAFYGEAE